MSRPRGFFSTDPEYAFPFAPFGVSGGGTYHGMGGLSIADMYYLWFRPRIVTFTLVMPVNPLSHDDGVTDEMIYVFQLVRQNMPSIPYEDWTHHPGNRAEYLFGPELAEGPFDYEGSFLAGGAGGYPDGDDPVFEMIGFNANMTFCGVNITAFGTSEKPEDRFAIESGDYAPTFVINIECPFDDGVEETFYITTANPVDHGGADLTDVYDEYLDLEGTWDGYPFTYHCLRIPGGTITGPIALTVTTTTFLEWRERAGEINPIYDIDTGAELIDPETADADP